MGSPAQAGNNSLLSRLQPKYGQTASEPRLSHIEAGLTHRSCRPCDPLCPHTHHVQQQTWSELGCAVRSHWGTSCSPAAPQPRQPELSHRHLLCCRPSVKTSKYSLSVAQTPLPHPSSEVRRRRSAQRKST